MGLDSVVSRPSELVTRPSSSLSTLGEYAQSAPFSLFTSESPHASASCMATIE